MYVYECWHEGMYVQACRAHAFVCVHACMCLQSNIPLAAQCRASPKAQSTSASV